MAAVILSLHVYFEDGSESDVNTDHRDFSAYEVQPFGCNFGKAMEERPNHFFRWCAWNAMRRTKATGLKWDDWNDQVIEVEFKDSEDPNHGAPTATGER